MKTFLSLLLVVLSLLGIMDASYLTYEKLAGVLPPCGAGFDCGQVLNSQWASIGPIPLSALGLLFYATVFGLAVTHFLELKLAGWSPLLLLKYLTVFGFLFSLYLVSLMAFIIQAWCLYCLISAVISSSLFVVTQARTRYESDSD